MAHTNTKPELRKERSDNHHRDEVRYKLEEQAAWDELHDLDFTKGFFDLDFTNKGQKHGR